MVNVESFVKSIASIVLILMFGFSGLTASAQSSTLAETWESAREKASIQTDATVKKNYLDKALSLAAVPEEKVVSYLELSVLRYEQKIFGESHYFADLALQLVEKELPNNEELRTQAIAFKSEALAKLGRADEANKIIVENVERTSRKSDHVWSSGNKRVVHKFSHLQCPDAIGGMFF
jgi:anaerobic glycerol-3-phosphate dehydrogenase